VIQYIEELRSELDVKRLRNFRQMVFLKIEKSTVLRPGPYRLFRPAVPRRFWQNVMPAGTVQAPGVIKSSLRHGIIGTQFPVAKRCRRAWQGEAKPVLR